MQKMMGMFFEHRQFNGKNILTAIGIQFQLLDVVACWILCFVATKRFFEYPCQSLKEIVASIVLGEIAFFGIASFGNILFALCSSAFKSAFTGLSQSVIKGIVSMKVRLVNKIGDNAREVTSNEGYVEENSSLDIEDVSKSLGLHLQEFTKESKA